MNLIHFLSLLFNQVVVPGQGKELKQEEENMRVKEVIVKEGKEQEQNRTKVII